jgi:Tfp pilus assembly PilM family ATPase
MLFDFEKRYNKTVDSVVLSGGGSLLKGMLEIAQKNFDVPVIYADPFSLIKAPAFLTPVLTEAGPNFAVAVGLALRALEEL